MPFVWVNEPQIPVREVIEVPGPATISYKVDVVANNVNAGGSLLYNTPNSEYDIIYQIKSLNAHSVRIETATIDTMIVSGNATIGFANIANATFQNVTANTIYVEVGFSSNNPGSNLEIATKEYVDLSVANVPAGGSDLQNLIDAPGDLLAGIGPNTATRHPIGTVGQVLIADSSSNTGLRWKDLVQSSGTETVSGLFMQTHNRKDQNTHITLIRAVEIIMHDGIRTYNWSNLSANIDSTGAGGLDTGTKKHSQWYEVYAIREKSSDQRNIILHQSTNISLDASFVPTTNIARPLRQVSNTKGLLAQSFKTANSGPLTSFELELYRVGSPSGLIWITLQADSSGFPDGTVLSNSNFLQADTLPTDKGRVRFTFPSQTTLTANTSYHIVFEGNYSESDANYIALWGHTTTTYADGVASEYRTDFSDWVTSLSEGGAESFWFKTFIQNIEQTSLTLPSNYDEHAFLGYVYVNQNGQFKHMMQRDRIIHTSLSSDWNGFTTENGRLEVADLRSIVPPKRGIGLFYIYRSPGTPALHIPIGSLQATGMPITLTTGSGYVTSNTYGILNAASPGERLEPYAPIVVDNQAISIRSQGANCRVYIVEFEF